MEIRYQLKTKLQRFQKDNLEYILKFDKEISNVIISNEGKWLFVSFDTKSNEDLKRSEILKIIRSFDLPIELKNKTHAKNQKIFSKNSWIKKLFIKKWMGFIFILE